MSDVWYARQIAKQAVAAGCHVSTIRKHMRDGRGPARGAAGEGTSRRTAQPQARQEKEIESFSYTAMMRRYYKPVLGFSRNWEI